MTLIRHSLQLDVDVLSDSIVLLRNGSGLDRSSPKQDATVLIGSQRRGKLKINCVDEIEQSPPYTIFLKTSHPFQINEKQKSTILPRRSTRHDDDHDQPSNDHHTRFGPSRRPCHLRPLQRNCLRRSANPRPWRDQRPHPRISPTKNNRHIKALCNTPQR